MSVDLQGYVDCSLQMRKIQPVDPIFTVVRIFILKVGVIIIFIERNSKHYLD